MARRRRKDLSRDRVEKVRRDRETRRAGLVDGLSEQDYPLPWGDACWSPLDPSEEGGGA